MRQSSKAAIISFFLLSAPCYAALNMRGHTSFIRVSSGATLVIDQAIPAFNGTLIKEAGGILSGQDITFADGILQDLDSLLLLNGIFDVTGASLELTGNQTIRAENGQLVQSVAVSGSGNRIAGQPLFASDVTLQNSSAQLTLALQRAINKNVVLNGGTLDLADNLHFSDAKTITGNGTVNLNGYRLMLGGKDFSWSSNITWNNASDITLNSKIDLSGAFTFNGVSRVNGNGNILDITSGGSLIISSGATVYLTDIVIKGLGSGGGSLTFPDDTASVCMSNVTIELVGDVATTQGGILVEGPSTWVVKDHTWTFDTVASLTVDGVTLWKDHAGASTNGAIAFGSPQENYLTVLADGAIKVVGDDSSDNSRLNIVESCYEALQTSTGYLQDQIDDNDTDIADLNNLIGTVQINTEELEVSLDQMQCFTYQIELQGVVNELPSFAMLDAGLSLRDSGVVSTIYSGFPVLGDINLNGGTLSLGKDLVLQNTTQLIGGGTIVGNNHALTLPQTMNILGPSLVADTPFTFQDIVVSLHTDLTLTETLVFKGVCIIEGNDYTLSVAQGNIVVDNNATLYCRDITIADISDAKVRCATNTGTLVLQNAQWIQADDSVFTLGSLLFKNYVLMGGEGLFAYQSSQTSTVLAQSDLELDNGFTFSYDPSNNQNTLLAFEDDTAAIILNGAIIHATIGGLVLTGGRVMVERNSYLRSEKYVAVDNGITIGGGTAEGDCPVNFVSGVCLQITQGSLNYNNVLNDSWYMANERAVLKMGGGTMLRLYENLCLGKGVLSCGSNMKLARVPGKDVKGSMHTTGSIMFTTINP